MTMQRFGYAELVAAFGALDAVATSKRQLVVIGGAAVALHTRSAASTKDIDTWQSRVADLVEACRERGISLPPIGEAGVADFPYEFEDRLVRVLPRLRHLEVRIPERHDLALSKILRWAPGDRDDVRELHDHEPLDRGLLVTRYLGEMKHVMGNHDEHDWNLVHCVEALYGEIAAEEAREQIVHARR